MISSSSSFASSMPATSAKVTLRAESEISRARLFPKDIALPPPACICRMKKIQTAMRSSMGNQLMRMVMYHGDSSRGLALI